MNSNTEGICKMAAAFMETGKQALSKVEFPLHGHESTVSTDMSLVAIVNFAFALELAIKAHLDNPPKTHDLRKLFDRLDENTKRTVIHDVLYYNQERWNSERTHAANIECDFNNLPGEQQTEELKAKVRKIVEQAEYPPQCDSEERFYSLLDECRKNFEDIRYIHEGKGRSIQMPFVFMQTVTKTLLTMGGLDYFSYDEGVIVPVKSDEGNRPR